MAVLIAYTNHGPNGSDGHVGSHAQVLAHLELAEAPPGAILTIKHQLERLLWLVCLLDGLRGLLFWLFAGLGACRVVRFYHFLCLFRVIFLIISRGLAPAFMDLDVRKKFTDLSITLTSIS